MSNLSALVAASLRNSYRNKAVALVMLGFSAFGIAILDALVCALAILPELRSPDPDADKVAAYLAMIAYGTGFIAMGMNLNVITANTLVREKAQRIYESILGAPVSVRKLWLAKSLAIFLPGIALCEAFSLTTLLGFDALLIAPVTGSLLSPAMLFSALALIPILYFPLCCLVILVGLEGNPVSGNVIANVAFSAILTLALNLVTRAGMDMRSPAFALGNLALAALLGLLVLSLQRGLTKERVVLSCRS
jgi:ABC-2 type transport system permease protein